MAARELGCVNVTLPVVVVDVVVVEQQQVCTRKL